MNDKEHGMNWLKKIFGKFLEISFIGQISLGIGVLGNGLVFLYGMTYFGVPRGTPIRDFGGAMLTLVIGCLTFLFGMPTALFCFRYSSKLVAFTALILSITPLPLYFILLHFTAYLCGFYLED